MWLIYCCMFSDDIIPENQEKLLQNATRTLGQFIDSAPVK